MKQPYIKSDTHIAHNATIAGDVHVEAYVMIMFNVVIRGEFHYVKIGEYTYILDNCKISASEFPVQIGSDCMLSENVVVKGSTIGNNVLINIGVIVLDGVTIGDFCLIENNCELREGQIIPPYSYVKTDGTVIPITEAQLNRIKQSAENYQLLYEEYKEGNIKIF